MLSVFVLPCSLETKGQILIILCLVSIFSVVLAVLALITGLTEGDLPDDSSDNPLTLRDNTITRIINNRSPSDLPLWQQRLLNAVAFVLLTGSGLIICRIILDKFPVPSVSEVRDILTSFH